MAALASGVPVITTRTSGYHGSLLTDRENVCFVERSVDSITESIRWLKAKRDRRALLSQNGRRFAEEHHDIGTIAAEYRNIFRAALGGTRRLRISFVPVKFPVQSTATARLRCARVAGMLNATVGEHVCASVGLSDDADVIVVSQLASEAMLVELQARSVRGTAIVYDCCDPYYDRTEEVYGVMAAPRFWELVGVADIVTVPTEGMRQLMLEKGVTKEIVVIPDGIDYADQQKRSLVPALPSAVWFGNPGHGNIDAGLWALDHLKSKRNFAITLLSARNKATSQLPYAVEQWTYDGFVNRIREHGIALISQDPKATYKSQNRFVAAVANGVPTISVGSSSIRTLLEEIDSPELAVTTPEELDRAVDLLSDEAYRQNFMWRAQALIETQFGDVFIARRYYESVLRHVRPDLTGPAKIKLAGKLDAELTGSSDGGGATEGEAIIKTARHEQEVAA